MQRDTRSTHRILVFLGIAAAFSLGPAAADAQTTISQLWPNADGTSWTYEGSYEEVGEPIETFSGRLIFDGSEPNGSVIWQNLIGQIDGMPAKTRSAFSPPRDLPPLHRSLWRGRPELREALEARSKRLQFWPSILLAPAPWSGGVGHLQTPDFLGTYRNEIADLSWVYVSSPLEIGRSERFQLVPDLASDVFLNYEVRTLSGMVTTDVGTFPDAAIIDYVIEYGEGQIADESGNLIGTAVAETRGWVAFVPNVGPVASDEEFFVVSVDCPTGCPPFSDNVGGALSRATLSLTFGPVATDAMSFGSLKARF